MSERRVSPQTFHSLSSAMRKLLYLTFQAEYLPTAARSSFWAHSAAVQVRSRSLFGLLKKILQFKQDLIH